MQTLIVKSASFKQRQKSQFLTLEISFLFKKGHVSYENQMIR